MTRFSIAFIISLVGCSTSSFAWFDMGHMTVAAVAYQRLDPSVRSKIAKLLQRNPDYYQWTLAVPLGQREIVAFVHAATWADDIKSRHHEYIYHARASEDGDHAADNIGYDDFLSHPYWHFVDLPFSPDNTPLVNPEMPNALTQIQAFRDTLASSASDDVKSYDLVWLLHLVGDAHQPLHAISRFTQQLPKGDNGGNLESVCVAFTCGLKLHAFWDGLLGDHGRPDDAIVAAASLPAADPALAAIEDAQVWFDESAALAKQLVYTGPIDHGKGPFTIDATYQEQAMRVARERVALAGVRLAHLLNTALRD
jgi:hypothetical protein